MQCRLLWGLLWLCNELLQLSQLLQRDILAWLRLHSGRRLLMLHLRMRGEVTDAACEQRRTKQRAQEAHRDV